MVLVIPPCLPSPVPIHLIVTFSYIIPSIHHNRTIRHNITLQYFILPIKTHKQTATQQLVTCILNTWIFFLSIVQNTIQGPQKIIRIRQKKEIHQNTYTRQQYKAQHHNKGQPIAHYLHILVLKGGLVCISLHLYCQK